MQKTDAKIGSGIYRDSVTTVYYVPGLRGLSENLLGVFSKHVTQTRRFQRLLLSSAI